MPLTRNLNTFLIEQSLSLLLLALFICIFSTHSSLNIVLHQREYNNLFADLSLKETLKHFNGRKEILQLETHKNQQVSGKHFHFDETTLFAGKIFHLKIELILGHVKYCKIQNI